MQQSFVGFGRARAEAAAVAEIHFHGLQIDHVAGHFCVHADGDAFIGLDAEHQHIRLEWHGRFGGKQHGGRRFELDGDLGDAFGQAFAVAEVERHTSPAPVVDEQFQRNKRLGARVGGDVLFLPIAGRRVCPPSNRARTGRAR